MMVATSSVALRAAPLAWSASGLADVDEDGPCHDGGGRARAAASGRAIPGVDRWALDDQDVWRSWRRWKATASDRVVSSLARTRARARRRLDPPLRRSLDGSAPGYW